MSIAPVSHAGPARRVRHQAREAVGLMAFSVAMSMTVAAALVLLAHWGR